MSIGHIALLPDRGILAVTGPDARHFLQNIVTGDIDPVSGDRGGYAALLSPQGKIGYDFIVFPVTDGFWLDVARSELPTLIRRLMMYRLRAKVDLADLTKSYRVLAAWGRDDPPNYPGLVIRDPRLAALGFRIVGEVGRPAEIPPEYPAETTEAYHRYRISLGIPEGGRDFAFGEAFPHDGDLDQLGGVGFAKGCFVGQEIVSRMEHRGTARRRVIMVTGAADLPDRGAEILANGRPIGTLGSSDGSEGLAMVRLDRAKEAIDSGHVVTAGGVPVALSLPPWAKFTWPADLTAE